MSAIVQPSTKTVWLPASLLIALAFSVSVYLTTQEMADDPYWGLNYLQPLKFQQDQSHLELGNSPGYLAALAVLSRVTGLDYGQLLLFPLTGVLIAPMIGLLSWRISKSGALGLAAGAISALNIQRDPWAYNVQVFGFAYILAITFLLLLVMRVERRSPFQTVFSGIIVVLGMVTVYHSGSAWLGSVLLILAIFRLSRVWDVGVPSRTEVFLNGVAFLAFTKVLYNGLPAVLASGSLQEGLAKVVVPLIPWANYAFEESPFVYHKPLTDALGLFKLAFLAITAIPCFLLFVRFIRRKRNPAVVWGIVLLLLAALETIAYLIFGQFLLRLFFIFGPTAALIAIWNTTGSRQIRAVYALTVLFVASTILVMSVQGRDLNEAREFHVRATTAWISGHGQGHGVVTDLRSWGKIVQASADYPAVFFRGYDLPIYLDVIGIEETASWPPRTYVILNKMTSDLPIQAGRFEWVEYRPIEENDVDGVARFNKVFDDSRAAAYSRAGD